MWFPLGCTSFGETHHVEGKQAVGGMGLTHKQCLAMSIMKREKKPYNIIHERNEQVEKEATKPGRAAMQFYLVQPAVRLGVKTFRVAREHARPPNVAQTEVEHDDTFETDAATGVGGAS